MGGLEGLLQGYAGHIIGFSWEGFISQALRNGLGKQLHETYAYTFLGSLRAFERAGHHTPDYLFQDEQGRILAGDAKAGKTNGALDKTREAEQLERIIL